MALYHNLGNGKFEDVTKKAGLDPTVHAIGCTAGDYDNDGATDLAVSLEWPRASAAQREERHVQGRHRQRRGSRATDSILRLTFIDYDHDGDLDLYVTSTVQQCRSAPTAAGDQCRAAMFRPLMSMWRNNGNGTFTDVTAKRPVWQVTFPASRRSGRTTTTIGPSIWW